MVTLIRSDLEFILQQILIAEQHAAGADLLSLLPNVQVPWGLRTVDGSFNNLVIGQSEFGAADNVFPRLTAPVFQEADPVSIDLDGPGPLQLGDPTSYQQTAGFVFDPEPRIISNLIVDQTSNNPAAIAAAGANPNSAVVISPGLDGRFGTLDDTAVNYIPNITPDFGLTAPFNAWFTFFGQFFDHGLDLVTKGGSGTVFIPLMPDDPLYNPGPDGIAGNADDASTNFMVLTRATNLPGPDGILGTADDIHEQQNTTTPFVDQNQTYTSHPSHQAFLRAYELDTNGHPIATGKLITNRDLGADHHFGTADDVEIGGMSTWAVVKAQARDILGFNLTDADVFDVPLLAADAYGNLIRGPHGFAMVMMKGADGVADTADDVLVEGNPLAPVDLTNAVRTGHQFLIDVAHSADPSASPGLVRDNNGVIGGPQPVGTYDGELLDAHYIAGDGRVNENIGLTAVHAVFHSEHNRLVEQAKSTVLATHDLAFLEQWLQPGTAPASFPVTQAQIDALHWNGDRLFQVAKFGTEMQYQHLVFEEFARTIQPNIDEFLAPNGYDTQIDPSIVAEFAHTVYRFGHSMLTETVDRFDPNFNVVASGPTQPDQQLGLIAAFLNPLAYAASGLTPEEATGAIARGVTRTVGNEIDEFVTEALRNNLVGLPLDLAVLNLARGRDTGIPSLNTARHEFYDMTGDAQLKPYTSWADLVMNLKHPESLINFIAAYGTHSGLTAADVDTLTEKRAVAAALVLGGSAVINPGTLDERIFVAGEADRQAFLHSTDAYANNPDGTTTTGVDLIDFWIGGLAERVAQQLPSAGLLGPTFNFVFETQLEALQNADRFYYLSRTAGLNFGTELEQNTFAQLVMANSDATHLPADIFQTPAFILEADQTHQFNAGLGHADPTGGITIAGHEVIPLVIRDNPDTIGPDAHYLHYTGADTVVLGGTPADDILIAGSSDDDTVYGDGGNDRLEGGFGDDNLFGGSGDDIISDMGGNDTIHGDAGNDVIVDGHSIDAVGNILIGGAGKDFIITTEDISTIFGGTGDDFILGAKVNLPETGNEGDDWIEKGTQDGAPGDNMNPFLLDNVPGNDIFVGGGGFDEMIGEGGDDIFVGSDAQDKMDGMSGFDWVTYKNDHFGVTVDLELAALNEPPIAASPASILDRFAEVEGLSGSAFSDYLRGDESDAAAIATLTALGSVLTNISLISGLQEVVGAGVTSFGAGNIILGGDGSDIILGLGGDDIIDGDKWLNVRISVHANADGTGPEIASFDSMEPMIPLMLNGTYNPGQLVAVREILPGHGGFDTAVYRGNRADYTVTVNDNGTPLDFSDDIVTVTDVSARPVDGSDRLTHVERLQFADQSVTVVPGLNHDPVGAATIADVNGGVVQVGDFLTASIAGVTDADNPGGAITGDVRFTWQAEFRPGTGVFDDIILLPGGDLAFESASGAVFRVNPAMDGLLLRVKAIYQDAHGVLEQVFSAPTAAVTPIPLPTPTTPIEPGPDITAGGAGVHLVRSDLDFILKQIKIAEAHADGTPLEDLIPNIRLAYGLRTVDGTYNNLLDLSDVNQSEFGSADTTFPRLLHPVFQDAEPVTIDLDGPGPLHLGDPTSYSQTSGFVFDSQPRVISNLIVDQTANNPAAIAAAGANDGALPVVSPGLDGLFGTPDDKEVFFLPNVTPDFGLTAPFNAWFTFFGQFFDHGLDLVTKGGNGTVFVPLKLDDPLYNPGPDGIAGTSDDAPTNFMVLSRATMLPGPDGVLGTADDIHENQNTTTPFVDQNQTYTSHPSHQVFLRAYDLDADNHPIATGKLITNRDLGADHHFGTADDVEIGGMATWAAVKAQARDILGIDLTDANVFNVPLLATDPYGNFIKGPHGLPQVVMKGADGLAGTADDFLMEGNLDAPISLANAVGTGHQFLIDIAHSADPSAAPGLVRDDNGVIGGPQPAGTYDGELLDAHYIAGDGRANENIGLTAVHSIFHHEHNRLVDQTKETVLASHDLAFLNEWLLDPVTALPTSQAQIDSLHWNGERLFQVAKFGTEMQYQHLVFEEFARTVQPMIDPFFAPTQVYDVDLNPAIVAEFAHTVYRFGHSMLTETVDRFDPSFNAVTSDPLHPTNEDQLGLIAAFLNPLAFAASGPTPEEATGAIVRGVTREVGNEIDEFVTEALRNNLVGLPLDLAVLNLSRGRDVGIPSLNAARRDFYTQTGDPWVKPYTSWADLVQHLKHPESLVNFIAAYGTHAALHAPDVDTLLEMRAVATALVLGGSAVINAGTPDERTFVAEEADRLDFLNSAGIYASLPSGVTTTGVDAIDFWVGGLAEQQTVFGGLLGSTFNFVFENQLEKLQDGDRFYYLERTTGLSFGNELESNSFAKLIMANTDAVHLPGLVFQTPGFTLEADQAHQFNAHTGVFLAGPDGVLGTADDVEDTHADPVGGITIGGTEVTPLVIRDNPDTVGPDDHYLHYTGKETVVLGGTPGDDFLIAGDSDDDTVWGDAGNDHIDGGYGADQLRGGAGDDIIADRGGDDNIQGGDGNDVIQGGSGANLILGGFGNDFIITGEDSSEAFGGAGDDFILGSKANEQDIGNEGDDWIEKGTSDGAPGDNFDPLGLDPIRGNDVFIGDGENDKFIGEGGDDIMVGKVGLTDRYFGGSGFDWADFKDDRIGVTIDLDGRFFDQPPVPGSGASALARFDIVEGLSGSAHNDVLQGDSVVDLVGGEVGGAPGGSALANIALIDGLQEFLGAGVTAFTTGNIILGGAGSDIMEGRGGDDIIDGDAWLNVRISVRANPDGSGPEIDTFDSMVPLVPFMVNGTYNPGQLKIVREILYAPGPDFDTVVFTGNSSDYTIITDDRGTFDTSDDIITVVDSVANRDGSDRLTHVERLQFADQALVLGGLDSVPDGAPTITQGPNGQLTVSIAGVTDADNVTDTNPTGAITGPVAYFWQQELRPGSGIFSDITFVAGGEFARQEGVTFTPGDAQAGLLLRARAVYKDGLGVLEQVFSDPTAPVPVGNRVPVGVPTISDTTPTEGIALTASTAGISDADGLTTATFDFKWQQSPDGLTWSDIAGATTASFTPAQAQVLQLLRVVVTYTDDLGTTETVTSAATGNVGDLITGTAAANTIPGTAFDDWIQGLGGADILNGNAGGDLLDGGAGNDTLNGGAGFDTLLGGAGNDTLNGGADADSMSGGAGNDIYVVDDAGDVIMEAAPDGLDTVQATLNTYSLALAANVENLTFTGTGNFVGTGNDLDNVITGGTGADMLDGAGGNDTLHGAAGNDILIGGLGNDVLDGGAGDDVLIGGLGNDTLAGGAGVDTASYAGDTTDVFVDLTAGTARHGSAGAPVEDTITGIENVTGGSGNDTLTAGTGSNILDGGAGNDTLSSGGGADTLLGGLGDDTLHGGAGADVVHGDAGNDTITYAMGDGADTVDGGVGTDTLAISGTAGNDTLHVVFDGTSLTGVENGSVTGVEAVTASMLGGTDTVSYAGSTAGVTVDLGTGHASGFTSISGIENVTGGAGADAFFGSVANAVLNTLAGGAGNDTYHVDGGETIVEAANAGTDTVISSVSFTLGANVENLIFDGNGNLVGTGNGLANTIIGNSGNNTLIGAGGADHITGGAGDDAMTGGAGNDIFVFAAGFGHDTITDFDANPANGGQDHIDLTAFGIHAADFNAHVVITDLGADMLVTVDNVDAVTLVGVSGTGVNAINQQDFILAP